MAQWLRNSVKPCARCFGRVGMVRPTSACSLSCETCQRHSAASASGSAGKAGQGPCSHCISPMGMVNVVVGVNGRAKARAKEDSGAAAAVLRTLESLHDTQAVFLLMRDCGEDCSAADASRSRDSRDSPLDIVDEGSVSRCRCRCGCCGEGGWENVAEALPTTFAGSALRADGWGGDAYLKSHTSSEAPHTWLVLR